MIKIPTMFIRDEAKRGRPVLDQVKPECQWVLDGEGLATVKIDGTNVKIEHGELLKRQKPKDRDYDEASYVRCERDNPADKWAFEAFDRTDDKHDGIYELQGPKVQGNPNGWPVHVLTCVVPVVNTLTLPGELDPPRDFAGLQGYLAKWPIEGLVFHHRDGRMAKIKRRDFGLPWPPPKA